MATNPPLPPRVNIKIEELRKSSIARRKEKDKHVEVELEAKRESLSNWSDSVRRVPNVALRSALFGAMRKGARPYVEQMEVNALGSVSILYTGALLDQGDLDVWAAVLHLGRMQELGVECRITAYRLLKILGKTDSGKNRRVLDLSISRLKATALQVKVGRYAYEGSLIHEVYRDHHERSERIYVIRLNPKLGVFFREDQFTDVDLSIRYALRGKPLAQWIHGFYSSHARPYDLKVETLHRLCRSRASSLIDFKKDLLKSLEAVKQASANVGRPFGYLVDAHLVQVKTTPSASQKRHLNKKR
ncbi:plasmid replication initiator TrfA [Pseudomonas asiatica]|uniref:Plasmid replication initiator TrfA n=1 Tax=Pseudomonas asiatica TaxID=2219225 RepID=A0ABU5KWM9_9PSED|nr:plasmid replication initiator TrfA [Pseudomonas asiatica]MDZ5738335.1 plasmid replication initiator TrfA [Pseudomonas asiatica]MDZ5742959.1 plasmid replication initiator TrfA [Pseudomonas asiatica]MDZ5748545.1 plasmid replication initiator TrfA [Pseudomonas asiatica]MDZ5753423.1 plasmid replication initiator TrfA [Pseudomonas asiatica]